MVHEECRSSSLDNLRKKKIKRKEHFERFILAFLVNVAVESSFPENITARESEIFSRHLVEETAFSSSFIE